MSPFLLALALAAIVAPRGCISGVTKSKQMHARTYVHEHRHRRSKSLSGGLAGSDETRLS